MPTAAGLAYREAGPSDGPVALLLHGYPESSYMWREVLPALAGAGWRALAPDLAGFYPSAGGSVAPGVSESFSALVEQRRDELAALIEHPVQTNEPGRSAALLGGFLETARRTRLPLRTLEVGASAGLNLILDHYRYRLGGLSINKMVAGPLFSPEWEGVPPPK